MYWFPGRLKDRGGLEEKLWRDTVHLFVGALGRPIESQILKNVRKIKFQIEAAKIATSTGCSTIICNGSKKNPIKFFLNKYVGTQFLSKVRRESGYKKWLAGTIKVTGNLVIDDGARKAIFSGASILPSGIKKISGNFFKGDIIDVNDMSGNKIGKGVTYYDSEELRIIMGRKTTEIKKLLGYDGREEIIHRDYLTLND